MKKQDNQKEKKEQPQRVFYGRDTKQRVIYDYKRSSASAAELARLYGIMGSNTVADWLEKYGNLPEKMEKPTLANDSEVKQSRTRRQRSMEQLRIADLEQQLAAAQLKARFYACALRVCSEATGIDLEKKTGERLSSVAAQKG